MACEAPKWVKYPGKIRDLEERAAYRHIRSIKTHEDQSKKLWT